MHSTKIYLHSLKRGAGLSNTANNSSNFQCITLFLGDRGCIRMLHISSLSGCSLSPLANDTVKAPSSIGTPGQPHYPWWQAVCILDLSTQHRAADRTALLRRHLLAPLNPRAP